MSPLRRSSNVVQLRPRVPAGELRDRSLDATVRLLTDELLLKVHAGAMADADRSRTNAVQDACSREWARRKS